MKRHTIIASTLFLAINAYAEDKKLPCDTVAKEIIEHAQGEVKQISAFTAAIPKERIDPKYPINEAKRGSEGWAKISYVIDKEGNVKDLVVDDFGGSKSFARASLRAMKKWKFSPALKDGKPTEQCHSSIQMDFVLQNNNGATRKFVKKYKEAKSLIENNNLVGAESVLTSMVEGKYRNKYENAWMWSLYADYFNKVEDKEGELNALEKTLASSNIKNKAMQVFDDKVVSYLYRRTIVLQSDMRLYADLLSNYEQLQTLPIDSETLKPFDELVNEVNSIIDSDVHFHVNGRIENQGYWGHSLARNKFAFANVQGNLESVEVRCDSHREKYTVAEDNVWNIPESWGACSIYVNGAEGSKFELIEVAANVA